MENERSSYTYTPLDATTRQIRLLHLHPAYSEASSTHSPASADSITEIHCSFSIVSLNESLKYEALSYVWGDGDDRALIYLHGCLVSITRNLYDALLHLRQKAIRVLWVDALCIHQKDLEERASQVLLIGSVFEQASTVVVYLGFWKNADAGFRTIEAIGLDPFQHHYDATAMSLQFRSVGINLEPAVASAYLVEFFSLPWWDRVWTIQEYALAREAVFQSGCHLLSQRSFKSMLDSFYKHITCCNRSGSSGSPLSVVMRSLVTALFKGLALDNLSNAEGRWRMSPLLIVTMLRDRQCSDARDKIYGLLGLTDPSFRFRPEVRPDYQLPFRDVYTRATEAWISTSQTLDVLSYIDGQRTRSSDVPTYVFDLTAKVNNSDSYYPFRSRSMLPLFNASGVSLPEISILPSLEARAQAIYIDSVRQNVDKVMACLCTDTHSLNTCVSSLNHLLGRYASPADACWQTLCGGLVRSPEGPYRPVKPSDYAMYLGWRATDPAVVLRVGDQAKLFDAASHDASLGRYFAVTATGYLGLVPNHAKEGDCIVLMPGGKVPYVLRPVGNSDGNRGRGIVESDCYAFVGDCYIHGIMYGEAWDESKLQEITLV